MMDDEEVLEVVHLALRLICEDELRRLAPDLTPDELWAVAGQIQRRVGPKRGENLLTRVGRQLDAAIAEARTRKKKRDQLESMWQLAPKEPRA